MTRFAVRVLAGGGLAGGWWCWKRCWTAVPKVVRQRARTVAKGVTGRSGGFGPPGRAAFMARGGNGRKICFDQAHDVGVVKQSSCPKRAEFSNYRNGFLEGKV